MKKKVKALVIATSVAAIAGIGAVSFAAWEGQKTQSTNQSTATITTLAGLATITAPGDELLPYDQPGTPAEGNTTMWNIAVKALGDVSSYDLNCELTVTPASGKTFGGTIRVLLDTTATATAPTKENIGSWGTALTAGTPTKINTTTLATTDTTYYAHIVMVSSDATNDMNADLALEFSLGDLTA